jgi:hypothetical protein
MIIAGNDDQRSRDPGSRAIIFDLNFDFDAYLASQQDVSTDQKFKIFTIYNHENKMNDARIRVEQFVKSFRNPSF